MIKRTGPDGIPVSTFLNWDFEVHPWDTLPWWIREEYANDNLNIRDDALLYKGEVFEAGDHIKWVHEGQ